MQDLDSLEAVYYAGPCPNWLSLTTLACVFDRLHFPGVYMPTDFDQVEAFKELGRLASVSCLTMEDAQANQALAFALQRHHLEDFCIFTATEATAGEVDLDCHPLARALDVAIYGEEAPGTFRTVVPRWSKGLPGGDSIGAPGSVFYPANAFLYGCRNSLPVINDDGLLPVPSSGNARNNTKALASIMTLECVKLVVPNMPVLQPRDIAEMRSELKPLLKPFRSALLRLAGDLNALLTSETSASEVQRTARTLAETKVYPELRELRSSLEAAAKPFLKRAMGVFKEAPDIAQAFSTLPLPLATAKALGKVLGMLGDVFDDSGSNERLKRTGFYYLLRLPEVVSPE